MALSDRTKSILLQVAFKSASQVAPAEKVEETTGDWYNLLVGFHDKLGLNPDDAPKSAPRGVARRESNVEKAATVDAPVTILADGNMYFDYREAKKIGAVKENFPDFKLESNKQKSFWLLNKGEPTPFAIEMGLV